ncbi:MAG TPA: PQQ-binding-like beta-propeller repeat protein [Phycisphaerae bacterium]|nr:PQQ-binding-like beta-propeller repeat protein [Phycisphaerae bacterium]
MKGFLLPKVLPVMIGLIGAAAAAAWVLDLDLGAWRPVRTTGERDIPTRRPAAAREWGVRHETLSAEAPALPGLWPGFRGPDRDAICKDGAGLAEKWPAGGPRVLWRIQLGEGHAGPAVRNGKVYVMDYEPPPLLLIEESEIDDWPAFCRRLGMAGQSPAKTPHVRIWEMLPGEARLLIEQGTRQELATGDRRRVVAALNEIIQNRDFYRGDYFQGARLSPYLRLFIETDLILAVPAVRADAPYQKVLRINRGLFEQAMAGLLQERWKGDVIRCFALADGRELWRSSYRVNARIEHGISRAIPAVTDKHVVTLGPRCQVACFDAATGEALWHRKYQVAVDGQEQEHEFPYIDLVREYGATVPDWHAAQCPLIDARPDGVEAAIFAPGGRALFIAVDCATGRVLWETPTPQGWQRRMTHSSIAPMTFAGVRMYVYCFREGVVGVSAADGRLLWSTDEWKNNVIAPSPLPLPDGRIFFTAGFGGGSAMIQLEEQEGRIVARKLFEKKESELSCYQQTPIFHGGLIYFVVAAGLHKGQVACMDREGKVLWYSGSGSTFAWGPFALADGKMYLLHDSGVLTVARASAGGFATLDQAKVLDGSAAWAPMGFAGGRMLIRNETEMVCLDLAANSP